MVIDNGCMKTQDCIDACPNDALSIGFGSNAIGKRKKPREYDLSMGEEVWITLLFLVGFISFRGIYAFVPMLMAVGISLVGTWMIWKGVQVLTKENVSFHKIQLRFHGKLRRAGITYLTLTAIVLLFTTQSAAVFGFGMAGYFAQLNENEIDALLYYKLSGPISDGGIGLASNPNVDREMSKIHERRGEFSKAERLLWRVDRRVGPDAHATMLLGQVMQMNRAQQEIDAFYAYRLENNQRWELVWEDYVAWLKREGQYEKAIQMSRIAISINPDAGRLGLQNALTEMQHGDVEISVAFFTQETKRLPDNPNSWMLLARSLSAAGRTEEAREAATKASLLQNQLRP
jgi:Flp pilus assembly protein TadD